MLTVLRGKAGEAARELLEEEVGVAVGERDNLSMLTLHSLMLSNLRYIC